MLPCKKHKTSKKMGGDMPIISDGTGTYTIDPDGKKRYATAMEAKINDEILYSFDPVSGVLKISASATSIENLINAMGGLPPEGKDMFLPSPFGIEGDMHFPKVKTVVSITRKDETYFLTIK